MQVNITQIIQYGVLGVVLLLVITGHLIPGPVYDRLVNEKDAVQAKLDRLQQIVEERVIPALIRSNDVLSRIDPKRRGDGEWGDSFR